MCSMDGDLKQELSWELGSQARTLQIKKSVRPVSGCEVFIPAVIALRTVERNKQARKLTPSVFELFLIF